MFIYEVFSFVIVSSIENFIQYKSRLEYVCLEMIFNKNISIKSNNTADLLVRIRNICYISIYVKCESIQHLNIPMDCSSRGKE